MSRDGHSIADKNGESEAKATHGVDHHGSYLEPHVHPKPVHVPTSYPVGLDAVGSKWNTQRLGSRLAVDAASAAVAAVLICPFITIIDRSIIEKAAKGLPIRTSLASSFKSLITRPHHFIVSTPFLLIYTLYSCTYLTANLIDTTVSTLENKSFSDISTGPAKFAATALVNMSLCVYKDSRFVKLFGAQSSPSEPLKPRSANIPCHPTAATLQQAAPRIPLTSYSLFCLRDSLTIFASFNLPPLVSRHIPDAFASTPSGKKALAQFTIPATVQLFSTPVHLLGLDLYNRQPVGGLSAADRWARVKRDWIPSCAARIGRILPAYGVGGVANTRFRETLMESIDTWGD
ncbi:hypothetical protein FQN57_006531 [Myotisia sp. PD_48]|nr:hypothetical protein FQN57_006531 [Myotisia sp. PD_48]